MSRLYMETEHQELFVLQADLTGPVSVHVPSALARLGYYVCLRVPEQLASRFQSVRVHVQTGGLSPEDVDLGYGDGMDGAKQTVDSKAAGLCWIILCRAYVSRGDGTLSLSQAPAGLGHADLLLCTWTRFLHSGQADDWIACQQDPAWASGGIPLGGIGTGKVELCRDGRFRNFSGNNNQDMPLEDPDGLPGASLSVAVDGAERLLATRAAGGLSPVPALTARQHFPQIALAAADAFPGLQVRVEATAPLVPHDLRLSPLPGFLLRWRLHNGTAARLRASCRLSWPNLVGEGGGIGAEETRAGYGDGVYQYWSAPDGRSADRMDATDYVALRYGNTPNPHTAAADGHHYVAVALAQHACGEATPPERAWPTDADAIEVYADPVRGSVASAIDLGPGEAAFLDMAVVWEMPHWTDSEGAERGLFWQNFCRDGRELLSLLLRSRERIWSESGALGELLARTDLPEVIRTRLQNCCYPLVTNSVLLRDGRFSINEGPTEMAGCYGTLDQRLAAHTATLLFYPELNRRELGQFAAYQAPSGGVNHDLGGGHLERGASEQQWPDLTCSFILQLARHAWLLGDQVFAATYWPQARAALLRHAEWAREGQGVAQVGRNGMGTSYDGYHYEGTTPYMGTLWIATLQVARAWAQRIGDTSVIALTQKLEEAALQRMDADLWNGRYYSTYGSPDGPHNGNCHAGMLAGEFFTRTLTGGAVLPGDRLSLCMNAMLELNGNDRFAVPPDEVAPDLSSCTEYGWLPYVESFGLTALARTGDPRVTAIWKRILHAMDGDGRHPCDTRLIYQPLTGNPSWGAYYMTAPASWLVHEALLDFVYRPAEGVLRLQPQVRGSFPLIHPLFWGTGERTDAGIRVRVERVFGGAELTVRELEYGAENGPVRMDSRELPVTGRSGEYARAALPSPVRLTPQVAIEWETN